MLVDPVRPPRKPAPGRRDGHPPQKPREPISGDSRTVPRPRRHRDCRRQRRRCLTALPRAQRLSHNPPEGGLAEAPEGRDNIQAAARWLPTSDSNVPRTGRCRRPPGTPPRRPPKRPSSARSLRRRATRRDATPAAEEGRDAGKDLLRRLPRRRLTPPRDPGVLGGTFHGDAGGRWGLGAEAGSAERGAPASGIADSPGPPPPKEREREREREREGGREGGREGPAKRNQASAARRTKQDFGKQTQTREPRSKKGRGGDTLGTPTKRRRNSTWVETVTKSEDNKPKHAPVGGESALEVRRTWISNSLNWPQTPEWQAGGRAGGRSGVAGLRGWGLGGAGLGVGAGGGGGAAEGRGGEEDRTESTGIHSGNPVFRDNSQLNE